MKCHWEPRYRNVVSNNIKDVRVSALTCHVMLFYCLLANNTLCWLGVIFIIIIMAVRAERLERMWPTIFSMANVVITVIARYTLTYHLWNQKTKSVRPKQDIMLNVYQRWSFLWIDTLYFATMPWWTIVQLSAFVSPHTYTYPLQYHSHTNQ